MYMPFQIRMIIWEPHAKWNPVYNLDRPQTPVVLMRSIPVDSDPHYCYILYIIIFQCGSEITELFYKTGFLETNLLIHNQNDEIGQYPSLLHIRIKSIHLIG
jgi:hypothetical protein